MHWINNNHFCMRWVHINHECTGSISGIPVCTGFIPIVHECNRFTPSFSALVSCQSLLSALDFHCRIAFGAAPVAPARAARDEGGQADRPVFSGISAKLMARMGYQEGSALNMNTLAPNPLADANASCMSQLICHCCPDSPQQGTVSSR